MARAKLLVDTNVLIDFLSVRRPFYDEARLLMIAGRVGEFELWMTSSQVTDLIYVLSDGGRQALMPSVLERLRGLRTFVEVFAVGEAEVDRMLSSAWKDPEDALMFESALSLKADAIITRNAKDFESSLVRAMTAREFFDWLREEQGVDYQEVAF
ncbi:PIN domain nuclease [Slackia equolifaciens]|uniref:PIN domain nuclease n=1 Tax=Slackia equolifaciens TaxID=498718 RepID=A0A3N0ATM3_9ACTN|nr:PIN domain-containing protein [Slackia equolifaciens]RNL37988.1 PIN domain nuclease [Slackia equolifaciens]